MIQMSQLKRLMLKAIKECKTDKEVADLINDFGKAYFKRQIPHLSEFITNQFEIISN